MKRTGKTTFSVMVILFVILTSDFVLAETRNITESNRKVLAGVVDLMQRTEMMRISRGRLKSNPVIYPHHTIYQNLLQNQDYLIRNHTESYANSLSRLIRVREEFMPDSISEKGRVIIDYFKAELIRQYDLGSQFDDVETLLETNNVIERSKSAIDILPIRARLAFDARRWAFVYFGSGELPDDFEKKLETLMKEYEPSKDVFEAEESIAALSTAYSKLFVEIVGEKRSGR